jgi:hypothetical protein
MKVYRTLLMILLALVLGNCSSLSSETEADQNSTPSGPKEIPSEDTPFTTASLPSIQESDTETNPSLPIPAIRGIQTVIEKAKEDLAQRRLISTSEIQLIESEEVLWSDTSLGCPHPGTAYAQIVTPGYLIKLEANGIEFEYHANIHNYVFYCENPMPPVLETPSGVNP